jgi:pilus assembly protein CpaD
MARATETITMISTHHQAALRAALFAGCALLLAACNTATTVTASLPDDYRQRHPIAIKEGPRTVDLFIGEKRGNLNGAQRAEVIAFAREWRREASGGILIDVPTDTGNAAAAARAAAEVRALLAAAGVPADAIGMRENRPKSPDKLATLRLHYPRMTAEAGPCGLWPHDLGPTYEREHYENREYHNFGCAAQRNLAAMVDNPADLVQPRGENTPPYTGRRTTVLDKYHRGESTATVYTDTTKGRITDIGN